MPENLDIHSCPAICEFGAHLTAEATIKAAGLRALELQTQLPPLFTELAPHIMYHQAMYHRSLLMMVIVRRIHSEIC